MKLLNLTKVIQSYDFKDYAFSLIADEIQGNILKSHGRGHTSHLFFRFNAGKVNEAKAFIKKLGESFVSSAKTQKQDSDTFKTTGEDKAFIGFYLSISGYKYLSIAPPSGLKSMKDSQTKLNDPIVDLWEEGFKDEVHAMILLAWGTSTDDISKHQNRFELEKLTNNFINLLQSNNLSTITTIERGDGIKKKGTDDDIEHFGYVDGISQPQFFSDDLEFTSNNNWNSLMSPNLVLVKDENSTTENAFGSFFVFRKLEQNVKGFKSAEQNLADQLGLKGDARERAGAMVVGRFENGMPITVNDEDTLPPAISNYNAGKINDFNYDNDALGAKCPFHSHIRKTNPRGGSQVLGASLEDEKQHMMARRGIIYGKRNNHPNDEKIDDMPEDSVGLLFMSFQSSLEKQFEFIQKNWVNNDSFVNPVNGKDIVGLDPVIGQGILSATQKYAHKYNNPSTIKTASPFGGFVTLKGGEYFFAPSMSFLKTII